MGGKGVDAGTGLVAADGSAAGGTDGEEEGLLQAGLEAELQARLGRLEEVSVVDLGQQAAAVLENLRSSSQAFRSADQLGSAK